MIRLYIFLALLTVGSYIVWKYIQKNKLRNRRQKEIKNLDEISEELETIKIVTLKLMEIEESFHKTIIEGALSEVIDIQTEILRLYNRNPLSLSDNARRLIINYTNSLLNILEKWQLLSQKSDQVEQLNESEEKIHSVLGKWYEILVRIRSRALEKEFDQLDAEIQSMNHGLNLDH